MSYDIYIGNAEIEVLEEDEDMPLSYSIQVHHMTHPEAPTFPDDTMTGNGNSRHPGYVAWAETMRQAKLHDLFFNKENGLMASHPGNAALRPDHAQKIEQALAQFRTRYPHAIPRFGDEANDEDAILARLIWLDWWVKYALAHCERPCIYNS